MRCPRWKALPEHPAGYYHCVSRIVDRRFVLKALERRKFRQFLREYAAFCGVRVLTWCVLSNHFHLLLEVPRKPDEPPPLDALIARLEFLSSTAVSAATARQCVNRWEAAGDTESPERLRQRLWAQMYDLSSFMKLLKQRFSQWFNRAHQRTGTLWEERFRSVLIEGPGSGLATVAAYIDLNPVRAGLVEDPKDYRWCGYAEAVAGDPEARSGLATSLGVPREAVLPEYRKWLFGQGEERAGTDEVGRPLRRGFDRAAVLAVMAQGGALGRAEVLRLRVRYLVDGAVIGSRSFVDELFARHRERFGPKRTDGARPMRGLPGLSALRALRLRVIT
ncbi:MAG: transposase [Verrucomicrobiota bacterium]